MTYADWKALIGERLLGNENRVNTERFRDAAILDVAIELQASVPSLAQRYIVTMEAGDGVPDGEAMRFAMGDILDGIEGESTILDITYYVRDPADFEGQAVTPKFRLVRVDPQYDAQMIAGSYAGKEGCRGLSRGYYLVDRGFRYVLVTPVLQGDEQIQFAIRSVLHSIDDEDEVTFTRDDAQIAAHYVMARYSQDMDNDLNAYEAHMLQYKRLKRVRMANENQKHLGVPISK